jgi:hypothetical protein
MYKFIPLILPLFLAGCMTSAEYQHYLDANKDIANLNAQAAQRPLVDIEWCGDGQRICKLGVYPQANLLPYVRQKKDNEWVGTVNNLVTAGATVGGISVAGSVVKSIASTVGKSAGHDTTITGSYNTDRHDTAIADSGNTHTYTDSYNTDAHTTTDSHNVDSHAVDNHAVDNHAVDSHAVDSHAVDSHATIPQ